MQKPGAIQLSLQRQLKLARKAESAFKSTPPARERERDYVHLIIISQCNLATFDPETFTKLSPGVGGAEPRWQHFHHQVQPHQRIDPGQGTSFLPLDGGIRNTVQTRLSKGYGKSSLRIIESR